MNYDKSKSILDVVFDTRKRKHPLNQDGFTVINFKGTRRKRQQLLRWIDANTTGHFYYGFSIISFELEQDAIIFQLGYKE